MGMEHLIFVQLTKQKVCNVKASLAGSISYRCNFSKSGSFDGNQARDKKFFKILSERIEATIPKEERMVKVDWEIDNNVCPPIADLRLGGPQLAQLSEILQGMRINPIKMYFELQFFPNKVDKGLGAIEAHLKRTPEGDYVCAGVEMKLVADTEELAQMIKEVHVWGDREEDVFNVELGWQNWMEKSETWDVEAYGYINFDADLQVLTMDGAYLCHSLFLSGLSPAIDKLLKNHPNSENNAVISLEKASKAGMMSLLEFIYEGCLPKYFEKIPVFVLIILLRIAQEYTIPCLLTDVVGILLMKSKDEFSVDEAMELYLLSRNQKGMEILLKKVMDILRKNPDDLIMESPFFSEAVHTKEFFKMMRNKTCNHCAVTTAPV